MSPNMQRIATGLPLAALLVLALWQGGRLFFGFILIASVLAQWEFYSIVWKESRWKYHSVVACLLGAGVLWAGYISNDKLLLLLIGASAFLAGLFFIADYQKSDASRLNQHSLLPFGVLYIPLIMQLLFALQTAEQVLVMAAAIASDTGAFYIGCRFGAHRLAPRISPKKSWEGAIGGLLSCAVVTIFVGAFVCPAPWWVWAVLGAFLSVAGQVGDLFESALKRVGDVKDSGYLLPGHGGVLDRIDGLLFVIVTYSFVRILILP